MWINPVAPVASAPSPRAMSEAVLPLERLRRRRRRAPVAERGPAAKRDPVPPRRWMALVGGFHLPADERDWVLAGRDGGAVRSLLEARLFACSPGGFRAARTAARRLRRTECPDGIDLIARVVATGSWERPVDVFEAWRLEGPAPVPLDRYWFA